MNLEQKIERAGSAVNLLRNSGAGAFVYPVVAPEYTNWRDEQRAWRENVVLFDQSHHMQELMIDGPDAEKLLSYVAINTFANSAPGKAKQIVGVSPSGHIIGDNILFRESETEFNMVGKVQLMNWIKYQASIGDYDVELKEDARSPSRPEGKPVTRRHFRFQVQGPNAPEVLSRLAGGAVPDIKFFNMDWIEIQGTKYRALRHGMAGVPGLEIYGPYDDYDRVRDAILEAGAGFDIVRVGARAYATNTLESGWIPSPVPAIYSGEETRGYREWLPGASLEGVHALGGSYVSDKIEDYYSTPWSLGYGFVAKFDHDFIGREALEKLAPTAEQEQRRKVTFEWNPEDVVAAYATMFEEGEHVKYMDWPLSNSASLNFDKVLKDGRLAGVSMFSGYSYNERRMLSLGSVDPDVKEGDVLTLIWGEGGPGNPRQAEIQVRVSPTPFATVARESYADGWRSKSS